MWSDLPLISFSGCLTARSRTLCSANGVIRGLGDFVGLLERAGFGAPFIAFTKDGEEEGGTKAGSGGGGGGPIEGTGGGGGGGGLKLPLKDELGWISISGDGGGGNSGEVEQARGGLRV